MDIFILPFIFSVWAAISFLLLLQVIFSVRTFKLIAAFSVRSFQEIYQWILFLSWVTISSYTGCFWWTFIQTILIVPIGFYTFVWYVYGFGLMHCKRSLIDILKKSCSRNRFEGCIGKSDDFDSLRRRCFNHNIIAHRVAQTKWLALKCSTKRVVSLVHDCPSSNIDSMAPKIHGYKTYFTMIDESKGKQISERKHSMPIRLYFAICNFSSTEFVFLQLPRKPPKGVITSVLVQIIITGIFGIIAIQT